jgi:replicative DNA helicase
VPGDERERLTKVSNALRVLAKNTGVPVLAVSQLSRPRDGDANRRPNRFSLKESGSLENDAHVILLTYRPTNQYDQPIGEDQLIVAKQRHGPVGIERVYFKPEALKFYERQSADRTSEAR